MALVFSISETMNGLHHFVDPALGPATDQKAFLRLQWGGPLRHAINPLDLHFDAHGHLYFAGLTSDEVPCQGSITLDYLHQHVVRYELDFSVEGQPYRYIGEKTDVRLRHPLLLTKTHTTCYGTVCNHAGTIVSRSVLHFDLLSMPAFVTSLRVRWQ